MVYKKKPIAFTFVVSQAIGFHLLILSLQLNRIVSGTQPSNKSYATTFGFEPNLLPAGKRPTHSCYCKSNNLLYGVRA